MLQRVWRIAHQAWARRGGAARNDRRLAEIDQRLRRAMAAWLDGGDHHEYRHAYNEAIGLLDVDHEPIRLDQYRGEDVRLRAHRRMMFAAGVTFQAIGHLQAKGRADNAPAAAKRKAMLHALSQGDKEPEALLDEIIGACAADHPHPR